MATARSALTPQVFRRILANKPIIHRDCLKPFCSNGHAKHYFSTHRRTTLPRNAYPLLIRQQRRNLFAFNLFGQSHRNVREPDLDPGVEVMQHYAKMERLRSRLPPVEEVAEAWTAFFKHRKSQKKGMEDIQAKLALQSLKYLHAKTASGEISEDVVKGLPFVPATWVIRLSGNRVTDTHVELIKLMRSLMPESNQLAFSEHVSALAKCGRPKEARDEILEFERTQASSKIQKQAAIEEFDEPEILDQPEAQASGSRPSTRLEPWIFVLQGYSKIGDEAGLLETLELMPPAFIKKPNVAVILLEFFSTRSQQAFGHLQHWWATYRDGTAHKQMSNKRDLMIGKTVNAVLKWCIRHEKIEFGHSVVRDAMSSSPPKSVWDATFVWAAGLRKGVDEIGRMMDVMEQSNESLLTKEDWRLPDSETINTLIEFAIERSDPYLAERFINLGRDRGINPDARTFVLQMEYRLSTDDVDGALIAYKNLQSQDLSLMEDIPVVNKLVVALCSSNRHDFDTIMNVVADMSDRRAAFEAPTVAKLSVLHLSRYELDDVLDLLNTYVAHYSSSDRALVRDAIVSFCIDEGTTTRRAWDSYHALKTHFDETGREQRTAIMQSFFARKRSDLAVAVFNHMRAHIRDDAIPNIETYISAFTSIAALKEREPLEVVHNQLKLDYHIDLNTRLYNVLMIAFVACGWPSNALGFWDDIVASREGPTYNSIHLAFRACEKSPFGDIKAQEIWRRLERTDIELDQSLWTSYIAALVGNGDIEMAFKVLEEAVGSNKVTPDAFLLASMFNASPNAYKQQEVEGGIKRVFPEMWPEIEKFGMKQVVFKVEGELLKTGLRSAQIDRSVAP